MKRRAVEIVVLLAALPSGVQQPSLAETTVYTDRATWEAAVGTYVTEDFNSLAETDFSIGTNHLGLFDIELTGNDPGTNGIRGSADVLNIDGSLFWHGQVGEDMIPTKPVPKRFPSLVFDIPVTGFGADWILGTKTIGPNLTLGIGSETIALEEHLAVVGKRPAGFVGVVATTPFDRIDFSVLSLKADFGMDNASFSPIPEPSSLILLSTGALGLLAYPWRRRRWS